MVVAAAAVIVAVRYEDLCRDCWPTLLLGWESSLCRTLAADLCWNRSLVCPSGEGVAPKTRSWLWSAIDLGHIMVWKGASRLHQTTRLCIPIRTRCSLCLALKINSWCMCIADALVVSLPPVASISCCLCFGCLLLLLLWLHLLLRMSWFLQLHRLHLLVLNVVAIVVVAASFALVALLLLGFLCCLYRLFCSSCICKGANVANCFTCY